MAKQVQPILVELKLQGYEEIAKLKSAFRGLDTTVKQSDATLSKARESLLKYGKGAQQSEALFQGMVSALEGLKAQADVTGPTFRQLERDITQYGESLRGSTMAQERQRTSLLAMARGASTSAAELRSVIRGLQDLQKGARPGSSAFVQLGRDIDTLQSRLRGLSEESRAFRSVLGQALSAKADTMVRQLENFRRVLADSASTAEQLATALRQVELLSVGEARSGLQRRADVFSSAEGERFFAQLRRTYEDLPKTQSIISQRINEVNTELQNVTGYERRRALTQELIRLNKELRNAVVEVTTAEQFAAMGLRQQMAARRAVSGGGGFGAFSAEVTQRTAAGRYTAAGQRTQEGAAAKAAAEEALQAVKESYQGRVDAANAALNRQVDLEVKAQQEINRRLDTANDELMRARDEEFQRDLQRWDRLIQAADRYANSRAFSKQYLGLQGRELSPFYEGVVGLGVGTPSMQASKYAGRDFGRVTTDVIEAFNLQLSEASRVANEGVGYFREAAIAHAGGSEHVRKILEQWDAASIPENMYPMAGETGDQYKRRLTEGTSLFDRVIKAFGISLDKAGDGVERSAEALRQSAIDFAAQEGKGEEVRTALSRYKTAGSIPMYMLPRESVETPGSYAQRIAGTQRPPLPDIGDISKASLTKLQDFRGLLQEIRNDIPPIGAEFKKLDREVAQTVKRIDAEIGKRTGAKRGLGAQGLTQIAGAAISGGIFGGPEGFLGGVAGGALGGVGGAFAGAAIGAQVAGLRQAAGAAAEYAAAINQQRRALSGVVDDSAAYQQSLAFIDQTSRALAIPQEQVTRNFTRLSASVLGAGGDVAAAQEAFAGIAAGIRGTGGSLADLDAALLATAQVFSKGKVSAEELRGQIGERLPGAFTLFAESIGKTPAELDKMLEQGRVTLDDFMKFVRTLDTEYGRQALAMAASTEAAGDRLKVAFGRMQEDVGKALLPIGAQFQSMFAEALDAVTPFLATALPMLGNAALEVAKNLDVLVATLGALATAALVNAAVNTTKLVAAFVSLTQAVLRARDAILASNAALLLNPWVALAAGVTAATVGLVRYYRAQKEVNDLINYGSGSTKELNDKKYELTKRLEEETGRLDAAIKRYGESGRVVDTLRKRVKDLEDQLNKVTGTHTVRLKLEREGYRFDDDGNVQSFQVEGVGSFNISGRGSKGQLVKGSSRSAFGAGDQKKQEEAAKSLLNAIDQREEAIAEARITREKQLADIRKQAIKQAESLEKGFAQQRIQLERDIAATRRQLSATQQDVAFEESALATSLSGGNVEALRAAQQITVAARERDEQRIQLEQKILDDQKANAESIEDFKKQTADTINEANVRYAEAIGKAQQQYAKAVAKIIEEGTGRSGKRLEAAGRLTAALLERATAQQAFTASIGVGITRKTEKGVSGYQAGARFFTSEEELIDTLTRLGYPNIAEPFIAAEKAIQAADSALAKLPTASISASTAVGAVSVDISDLNAKLAVSVANLNAFREQQAALSADLQSMQAYKDFAAAATNAAAPLGQTIRGQVQEIEAATKVRALRLSDGMSGQEATGYIQILQQEIAAAELLTSTYEAADAAAESQADKDRLKKMYEGVRDSIAEAAIQAKRLNEEINNVPSRLIIQDAILNTRDNLNDLTKTGNVVVTAANNIGDAFGDAFNKLITGAGSAKQVLADFFQSVANSFFKMAQEIIGQLLVMITLQAVGKIFGLAGSAAGAAGTSTAPVSGIQPGESFNLSPKITTGILAAAQGHAFAPQGHLERYAKGGIVNQATMFRFAKGGSFAPGVMGEAGPEAILPLQRTPSGDLGVRAVPYMRGQDKTPLQVPFRRQDEDFTTGSTEGAIRFESTVINSQELVTRDEAERIGQAAASRGAQIAQRRMKNNPQVRRSLGIA